MVFKDGSNRAVGDLTLGVFGDDPQVVVLNRVVVDVEFEGAAHRVKLGRFKGFANRRLVFQFALAVANSGINQFGRVIALGCVQRR